MVVTRDIEPWDELLQAGRDDDRLVTQSSVHPRPGKRAQIPEELHPQVTEALQAKGIDSLYGRTRPRRSTPAGPARRS